MRENSITKKILDLARDDPDIFLIKYHGSRFGRAGIPDLVGNIGPYALYIEVKRPTGTISKIQQFTFQKIRQTDAPVFVVSSVDDARRIFCTFRKKLKNSR